MLRLGRRMFFLAPATAASSSTCSNPPIISLRHRNPWGLPLGRISCSPFSTCVAEASSRPEWRGTRAGERLVETVGEESDRSRLDSWVTSRIPGVSRARIQSSIRSGLVTVNGRKIDKVSHVIRAGDDVSCVISPLQPLTAEPEDIPLDIVYEDNHILVVNKPAHMVVHPAPGNPNGTLVNAVLHHCRLSAIPCATNGTLSETEEVSSDNEFDSIFSLTSSNSDVEASVRPGIVHRLDKGTSGLLVIAKDEHSHAHLAEQFKSHTIHRVYVSLTSGVPSPQTSRVDVPIARDPNNRVRMTAVSGTSKTRYARNAASRYKVLEVLAGGGSALVEWRLETGRTHQIRAHAKYLGIPLLGDETYGGTNNFALSLLRPKTPSFLHGEISRILSKVERPCLHALSLGFKHPHTGEDVKFSRPPPMDFSKLLCELRNIGLEKIPHKNLDMT